MAINYTIPTRNIPLTDASGSMSLPWFQYFNSLSPNHEPLESAIVVGASPFAYQATDDGFVIVAGGTVSSITLNRFTGAQPVQTSGAIPVGRGDVLTVTWSGKPTMTMYPT